MKASVVVIGASGHGKVVADIIERNGDRVLGYLDDDESLGKIFHGYSILGTVDEYLSYVQYSFIVAIGNAGIRKKLEKKGILVGIRQLIRQQLLLRVYYWERERLLCRVL